MEVQKVTTNSINTQGGFRTMMHFVVRQELLGQSVMLFEPDAMELYRKLGQLLGIKEDLPKDVKEFIREGKKINAIKALRDQTSMGLKEAKDAVVEWMASNPNPT
jgi:Ribosomal protein L7/L12 C-terminal domain